MTLSSKFYILCTDLWNTCILSCPQGFHMLSHLYSFTDDKLRCTHFRERQTEETNFSIFQKLEIKIESGFMTTGILSWSI